MGVLAGNVFFIWIAATAFLLSESGGEDVYVHKCILHNSCCFDYPQNLSVKYKTEHEITAAENKEFYMRISEGINLKNGKRVDIEKDREEMKKYFDKVIYRHMGKGWYVLSGYRGNEILYVKSYITPGYICRLQMWYHRRNKEKYDKRVTRISRSFKVGRIEQLEKEEKIRRNTQR